MEFMLFLMQYGWIIFLLLTIGSILIPIILAVCIVGIKKECTIIRKQLEWLQNLEYQKHNQNQYQRNSTPPIQQPIKQNEYTYLTDESQLKRRK